MPSQRGHMPPVIEKLRVSGAPEIRSSVIAPVTDADATLKENACGEPMCGCPSLLNRMRSMV